MFRLLSRYHQTRSIHLLHNKAFINNQWRDAISRETFEVTSPMSQEPIGQVPDMTIDDTDRAIQAARIAFQGWKNTTGKERSNFLKKWHSLIETHSEDLAYIICLEAGKPITDARNEIKFGNSYVEFFSEEATRIHGEIISCPVRNKKIFLEKQPIGVVGLITPWNFPLALIARKTAAVLAAGCTCVIKPAEDTPFSALALMDLAQKAGFPDGVLNVVTASRKNAPYVGNLLCRSSQVAGISFTGSTPVGKILYKECSHGIKRISLELGGNAPFIVFSSADINKAVKAAMLSKFRNCGQTCVSSNRFFVHCDRYDAFAHQLTKEVKQLQVGDLDDPEVSIGPLINRSQFEKVSSFVKDAIANGAVVLTGAKALPNCGPLFYEPTVLGEVTEDMCVYKEEVFGPVVNLLRFRDEEECIQMANDSEAALAAYIFSEDVAQIFRVNKKLDVGMCGINEGSITMAEAPFGGLKESGLGREGSHYGINEFVYIKYTCLGNL